MYRQNERDIAYVGQTDIDQVRYSELVLKLAKQQRSVTRSDVAELLHINPPQAHHGAVDKVCFQKYGLAKSLSNSIYLIVNNNKQARKTYLLFR